ncbi:MAG: CPBP family intramembrane metalloprotease [Chlamydia sp.]
MGKSNLFSLRLKLFSLLFLIVSLFVMAPVLSHLILSQLSDRSFPYKQEFLLQHSLSSALFILLTIPVLRIIPEKERSLLLGSNAIVNIKKLFKGILYALISYPLFLFFHYCSTTLLIYISGEISPVQSVFALLESGKENLLIFCLSSLTIVILAPISEELLFRGVLDTFFRSWICPLYSSICSSSIFAWLHYTKEQGISNYSIMSTLFGFGLFSSYLRKKEGHLMTSIGFHITFNALSLCMFYMQGSS